MVIDFSDQQYTKKKTVLRETRADVFASKKKLIYLAIIVVALAGTLILVKSFLSINGSPATLQSIEKTLPPGVPLEAPSLDKMPQVVPK